MLRRHGVRVELFALIMKFNGILSSAGFCRDFEPPAQENTSVCGTYSFGNLPPIGDPKKNVKLSVTRSVPLQTGHLVNFCTVLYLGIYPREHTEFEGLLPLAGPGVPFWSGPPPLLPPRFLQNHAGTGNFKGKTPILSQF